MFFFFNDTATTEIYTLSLHDALPICESHAAYFLQEQDMTRYDAVNYISHGIAKRPGMTETRTPRGAEEESNERPSGGSRSEEHTSELQSRQYLVCRLLLEKKKNS